MSDIPGVRPLSITVALTYVLIAPHFWFLLAAATARVGLTCYIIVAIA